MAVIQIPNLPAAIALAGSEQLEIVQAGVSCRTTTGAIANLNASAISALQSDVANLQSDVSTLQVDVAELQDVSCGSFQSRVNQTLVGASTPKLVQYEVTDLSYGVSIASNPSGPANTRITVNAKGIYNLQFSIQVQPTSAGKKAYFWLKYNGSDVSWSNTEIDLKDNNTKYLAAWNFFYSMNANDWLELSWASDHSGTFLSDGTPGAGLGPSIPSVIATMALVRRL